jgi:hypothetical protein
LRLELRSPALSKIPIWCDVVGCVSSRAAMTSHEHNSSSPSAEKKDSISLNILSSSAIRDLSWVMRSAGVELESTKPWLTRRLTLAWAMVLLKVTSNRNTY